MGDLGASELLIIALVVILLFGSKKLPEMARSLGRSARILKAETSGTHRDEDDGRAHPARVTASTASEPVSGTPVGVEQDHEADRIRKQIEDLQRQLTTVQESRNSG